VPHANSFLSRSSGWNLWYFAQMLHCKGSHKLYIHIHFSE
jgi:hypothetical protein